MKQYKYTFALAGNPNAGKTSIFNALTGARQRVGNYPGITVERKEGSVSYNGETANLVDLPGTYSLTAYSMDEVVARNHIVNERPDVVIDVIDSSNLERNLYLAVQFMELGIPVLICLNMVDLAKQYDINIDKEKLSAMLGGAPVVETVARKNQGLDELLEAAFKLAAENKPWRPLDISYGSDIDAALDELTPVMAKTMARLEMPEHPTARWYALKCLEGDNVALQSIMSDPEAAARVTPIYDRLNKHLHVTLDDEPENIVADYRYGFITAVGNAVVKQSLKMRLNFTDKVDKVLTHRVTGPLFLLGILYVVYQLIFYAGEAPVDWCGDIFAWLGEKVGGTMEEGPLRSLLVDGLINGLGAVLGFIPLIVAMFLAISILEDSGYLARMAYILDRLLRVFGLHGNAVICLVSSGGLSGGCGVPGVMAARTIKDRKTRLATILIVPFMNCGAKLPVYGLLIAAFFIDYRAEVLFGLTLFSWGMALLVARILRSSLLKGEQHPFVMELPPYRFPTIRGVAIHTWERSWEYLKRAGTLLLAVSIIMWALMSYPALPLHEQQRLDAAISVATDDDMRQALENQRAQAALTYTWAGRAGIFMEKYTTWLDLDWRMNVALLGGLAAKEVIVSTLGTAYFMSESQLEEEEDVQQDDTDTHTEARRMTLAQRLAEDPGWNPVKAVAIMVLVMIYSPCVATLSVMKRETNSWRWPLFSLLFNTLVAYFMAVAIYQVGRLIF